MNKLLLLCMQLILINSTNILHGMPSHTSTESLASNEASSMDVVEITSENHDPQTVLIPEDAYEQFAARLEEITFFESIRSNNYQQFIQLLEANPHFANLYLPGENETALTLATLHKQTSLVRKLLEYGANPNTPNTKGLTPLIIAARNGFYEVIKPLLSYNADIFYEHSFPNKIERSFNDWLLERSGSKQYSSSLRSIYKKEFDSFPATTALEHAIKSNSFDSVELLLIKYYHYFKRQHTDKHFCLFFRSHLYCIKQSILNAYETNNQDLTGTLSDLEEHEQKNKELTEHDFSTAQHKTIKQILMKNLHKILEKKEHLEKINLKFLKFYQDLKTIKANS